MTTLQTLPPEILLTPQRPRRWAPFAGFLVVVLAVLYVALPWWLPTDWIRRQVEAQLAADLNRPVHLGAVRASWRHGIVLEQLEISERQGAPNPLLARAGQICFALTPLTTAFTGRVQQIAVSDAEMWIVRDAEGRLNLDDLGNQRPSRLPSWHYLLEDAACHVWTSEARQTFRIDRLECDMEPASGLLRVFGQAEVARLPRWPGESNLGRFNLHARLIVPRLKRDEDLTGEVRAEWSNLALTDLPLMFIPRLPIQQVSGSTGGQLRLATRPDLTIDYSLGISLAGVSVIREGLDVPAQVPDAELRCGGRWDPNPRSDTIVLSDFEYETRAIRVRRAGRAGEPAVLIDRDSDTPFRMSLQGNIKDWAALRTEFPEIDAFARSVGAQLAGSADFEFGLTQQREEDRVLIAIEARDSQLKIEGREGTLADADRGLPKSLHFEMTQNRVTRQMSQPDVRVKLGDVEMRLRSEMDIPDPQPADLVQWLADTLPTLNSEVTLQVPRLEQLVRILPVLRRVNGSESWRGPARATVSIQPEEYASRLKISVVTQSDTSVLVADVLNKEPGRPLTLDAGTLIPHLATGSLPEVWFDLNYGPSRLLLAKPKLTPLAYSFRFLDSTAGDAAPVAADLGVELPLHGDHVEGLRSLAPALARLLPPELEFSGGVDLVARGAVSYRPNDWVVRSELEVIADALAVHWPERFEKSAASPLKLGLSQRLRVLNGVREQAFTGSVTAPPGSVAGVFAFTGNGSSEASDDLEQVSVEADVTDIAGLLRMIPAAGPQVERFRPVGGFSLQVSATLTAERQIVAATVEATRSGLVVPGSDGFEKPPGVPATITMQWEGTTRPAEGEQTWRLAGARGTLAGIDVTELRGEVVVGATQPMAAGLGRDMLRRARRVPALKSAVLETSGTIHFGPELQRLHPAPRRWAEQYGLTGSSQWNMQVRAEPGSLHASGRVVADEAGFAVPIEHDFVARVRKPSDAPAGMAFDVQATRALEGFHVEAKRIALALDGNHFVTSGTAKLAESSPGNWDATEFDLATQVSLEEPVRLLRWVPRSLLSDASGACRAEFRAVRDSGTTRLRAGEIEFTDFRLRAGQDPIRLDGRAVVGTSDIEVEQLRWDWGRSGGVLSGMLRHEGDSSVGIIGLSLDRLDVEDLQSQIDSIHWPKSQASAAPSAGAAQRMLDVLSQSNIDVNLNIDTVNLLLPLNVRVAAQAASAKAVIERGPVKLDFRCVVDGGIVRGKFETHTESDSPTSYLAYTADRIQPGDVVDTYLKLTFPGMSASGPLTLIDESAQRLLPGPEDPNYPVGKGELIIEGGAVEGRAAPAWVTRIFPGLNFARFEFSYMHSWFEKFSSGRIRHQMIYQGKFYNIYMIGHSEADGRIDYEVGIDFFADFDSKYWAESGQGRVPLFRKTGQKLPDGGLADEEVAYVPPQRIFSTLFVRNNPLITAYHVVRKRVLQEQ